MIWIIALAIFIVSCSDENISGGTGTQTTNTIQVLSADGSPIINTPVNIYDNANWFAKISLGKSPIQQTLKTNSQGILTIPDSIVSNLAIISYQQDDQETKNLIHLNSDTIKLRSTSNFTGNLMGYDSAYIAGTHLVSLIDSLGNFSFENLSSEGFQLIFKKDNSFSAGPFITSSSDSALFIDTLKSDIILTDFIGNENSSPSTIKYLGGILSNWYVYSAAASLNIFNDLFIANDSPFIRKEIIIDTLNNQPNIGWGVVFFGPKWKYGINLGGFDFLEVKIRGNIDLKISLETVLTENLNDSIGKDHGHFESSIKLTDNWKTHKIPYKNFLLSPYHSDFIDTHTLDEAIKKAIRLEFVVIKSSATSIENNWFEIDKITFTGVKEKLW